MDELTSYIQNDHRHAAISPETLERLGKEAATLLIREGVPLNDGIAKLAAAYADISQEQVKRICEFANTAAYLSTHEKFKTAGASSSYPQFDLADPARVIQDMSDGARPTGISPVDVDYSSLPKRKEKFSSAATESGLRQLFGDLSPGPAQTRESVFHEVLAAKDSLTGLRDHLRHHGEQFDFAVKEASAEYYDMVKRHLLDGGGFVDIMASARSTGAGDEKIAQVMSPVVERLMTEKVASRATLKASVMNLEKIAHRVVNPEHPFVKTFTAIVALNDEIEKVASGLSSVTDELNAVTDFIREQARA